MAMETIVTQAAVEPEATLTKAGPTHIPVSPQPRPNIADPTTSLRVIAFFVGSEYLYPFIAASCHTKNTIFEIIDCMVSPHKLKSMFSKPTCPS